MKIISFDFSTFGLDKSTDRVKGKSKGRRPIENDAVSCSPGRSESKVVLQFQHCHFRTRGQRSLLFHITLLNMYIHYKFSFIAINRVTK